MKDIYKKSHMTPLAAVLLPLFANQREVSSGEDYKGPEQSSVMEAKDNFTHLYLPKSYFRHDKRNQRSVSGFRVKADLLYEVVNRQSKVKWLHLLFQTWSQGLG